MLVYFDRRFVGSCWSAQLIGIIRCDDCDVLMVVVAWDEKKRRWKSRAKNCKNWGELFILEAEHPRCGLKKVYRVVSRWVAKIIHTTPTTAKLSTPTATQRYGKTKNNSQNFAFIKSKFIAPRFSRGLSIPLMMSRVRAFVAHMNGQMWQNTHLSEHIHSWEEKKVNEKRKRHSQALQRGEQQQPSDQSKKEKRKKEEKIYIYPRSSNKPNGTGDSLLLPHKKK